MKVRPGEPKDFERVFDLWRALVDNGHAADPRFKPVDDGRAIFAKWARQDWRVQGRPLPTLLVAELDGRVVGFLQGRTPQRLPVIEGHQNPIIGDLFVAPEARRAGVGRALVEDYLRRAKAAGFPSITVNTLAMDDRAVGFWKAMGFGDYMVTLRRPV